MNKKNLISICLITILLVFTYHAIGYGNDKPIIASDPLREIIQVMDNNHIEVESWTIFSKENWGSMSVDKVEETYKKVQENVDGYNWIVVEDKEIWKAIGLRKSNTAKIEEQLTLIAHGGHEQKDVYLQHKVTGDKASLNRWTTIGIEAQNELKELFVNNPQSFYCVEGKDSDKINSVLYKRAVLLMNEFSAEKIESINEETFVSLSAYTDKWKNDIPVKDGLMNLQVAIREGLGGAKTVTIGTPIITSEY